MFNKISLPFAIFIFAIVLIFHANSADAILNPANVPFGGVLIASVPCGCSTPLSTELFVFDFVTKQVIALNYIPGVSLLSTPQNIGGMFVPKTYKLGSFIRTLGFECTVGIPPACRNLRKLLPGILQWGIIGPLLPGIGTSLLPALTI